MTYLNRDPSSPGLPLPDDLNPTSFWCVSLKLPKDPKYVMAMLGALQQPCNWSEWQRDSGKRGRQAAKVWRDVYNSIMFNECAPTPNQGSGDCNCEECDCDMWRQDGCKLILTCNGVDVFTYDPTECIKKIASQPGQTTPPAAGDCQEWPVQLTGNGNWLLPVGVSEGDTIEISAYDGAWSDAPASNWYCPTGQPFVLGQCVGLGGPSSGDPLPSVDHMRIVAKVGSTYIDAIGPYTVPLGVTDAQVTYQANDSDISNNLGQVTFTVKYCKKASTPTWSHDFNFATGGAQGWQDVVSGGTTSPHQVLGGAGWVSQEVYAPAFNTYYNICFMKRPLAGSAHIQTVTVYYDDQVTTPDSDGNALGFGGTTDNNTTWSKDGLPSHGWTANLDVDSSRFAYFIIVGGKSGSPGIPGHVTVSRIVYTGTGTDPF
jgi:hypothetical protein